MDLDSVIDTKLLKTIPQQPQVQCSTTDQLVALKQLAIKFGLYDAADYLQTCAIDSVYARIAKAGL